MNAIAIDEAAAVSSGPVLFGGADRRLFGLLHAHAAQDAGRGSMLLCAPLLQEGIRTHRALWSVAESVAATGATALCFDWYGSGDSAGADPELGLAGLFDDLDAARRLLSGRSGGDRITWLALRSAALPLLSYLPTLVQPVDVVLWDPQLVGADVVDSWRRQHHAQLYDSGRYAHARHEPDPDDLLGFRVDAQTLATWSSFDVTATPLPRGSRVRLAQWQACDATARFVRTQQENAVEVGVIELEPSEQPAWEEPRQFGSQAYPRRSVAQLGQRLAAGMAQ